MVFKSERPSSIGELRGFLKDKLPEIWQEVLNIDKVDIYDNFFDLGGHSLFSIEVVAKLEEKLGIKVNQGALILQTIGQLTASCEERISLHREPETANTGFIQRLWNEFKGAVF